MSYVNLRMMRYLFRVFISIYFFQQQCINFKIPPLELTSITFDFSSLILYSFHNMTNVDLLEFILNDAQAVRTYNN